METLIANLTGKARRDTLAGRECLVVPLSMIVPGILNGSRGPLLYESPELKKSADSWNGMPIVLRHPVVNDLPVSARTPEILNQFGIGTVLTSKFDGKLKAEGWFDVQNAERIAPEILAKIKSGKPVELSTGLFADYVPAESGATFNGQSYDFKVTNMRPDHLAVLPDEVGACSLRDGCGVLVNSAKEPITNALSFQQIQHELQEALGERFSQGDAYACVTDVYDDFFIYQQGGDLYKLSYAKSDAGVSVTGDPIEVERVVTFVPEPESGESSSSGEMEMARNAAEKKAVVDSLIANSCGCWTEADREVLNQFKDERLDALVANSVKSKQQEQINNAVKTAVEAGVIVINEGKIEPKPAETVPAPVANAAAGPAKLEEWMKTAPPEAVRIVQNGLAAEQREKDSLIEQITANGANTFSKEALQAMGLDTLRPLASLAAPAAPAFYGANVGPVANRKATDDDNDGPVPPTINWADFSKQSA